MSCSSGDFDTVLLAPLFLRPQGAVLDLEPGGTESRAQSGAPGIHTETRKPG